MEAGKATELVELVEAAAGATYLGGTNLGVNLERALTFARASALMAEVAGIDVRPRRLVSTSTDRLMVCPLCRRVLEVVGIR
jgi:hypothetical protein